MSPEEIKLKCIELAKEQTCSPTASILQTAEQYADFVLGTEHARMRELLYGVEGSIQQS